MYVLVGRTCVVRRIKKTWFVLGFCLECFPVNGNNVNSSTETIKKKCKLKYYVKTHFSRIIYTG